MPTGAKSCRYIREIHNAGAFSVAATCIAHVTFPGGCIEAREHKRGVQLVGVAYACSDSRKENQMSVMPNVGHFLCKMSQSVTSEERADSRV